MIRLSCVVGPELMFLSNGTGTFWGGISLLAGTGTSSLYYKIPYCILFRRLWTSWASKKCYRLAAWFDRTWCFCHIGLAHFWGGISLLAGTSSLYYKIPYCIFIPQIMYKLVILKVLRLSCMVWPELMCLIYWTGTFCGVISLIGRKTHRVVIFFV